MIYPVQKLNKLGNNIQLVTIYSHTPFPIMNQLVVPCPVLDPHTGFSGTGKVVWYSYLLKNCPQFNVMHTVNGFSVVNKADVFLELPCFLHEMIACNLISDSVHYKNYL